MKDWEKFRAAIRAITDKAFADNLSAPYMTVLDDADLTDFDVDNEGLWDIEDRADVTSEDVTHVEV